MRVLVDTCVWSAALRRSRSASGSTPASPLTDDAAPEFRRLVLEHRVEIIGPIRQEVLSGIREKAQFERLESHLAAFSDLPLDTEDFVEAARFFNRCRAGGIQGSNTDLLICAVAARRNLAIFTTDNDFPLFAKHLPVVLHRSRERAS